MKIAQILTPEAVIIEISADSRRAALERLVSALADAKGVNVELALRDLAARDRTGPVLLPVPPHAVAMPHAWTKACRQLVMAVATSREGVPWNCAPKKRASLIFVFLGPPETQPLYLRILGRLARLCQTEGFIESMLGSTSTHQLIARLAAVEEPMGELPSAEGMPTVSVLGAGAGGMAMAAHLAITGCKVNLFNRTDERLDPVLARGGISVTGEVEGFAALNLATSDPAEALKDVDIAMVVVPATAHHDLGEIIAPHLEDGQIVVLNPGRTGGALEVAKIIRERNAAVRVYVAEAQTLLYAARVTNPGQVHIFGIKNSVPLATLPAYEIPDVLPVICKPLPQFVPGDNVLKTSLDNVGAVFHPVITALNVARIEDTHGDFDYYIQGVTKSVAEVLEAVDRERVSVAAALGIRCHTAREWLYLAYNAAGSKLLDAVRANPGYVGIKAPGTIQHRYISEDVPASLVPIASIGEMLKVPTPTIRSVIHLASVMHGIDYWAEGRTVERLGIAGMSVKDIRLMTVGAERGSE